MELKITKEDISRAVVWRNENLDEDGNMLDRSDIDTVGDICSNCVVAQAVLSAGYTDPRVGFRTVKAIDPDGDRVRWTLAVDDGKKTTFRLAKSWGEIKPGYITLRPAEPTL